MMGVGGTGCGVLFLFKIHTIMIAPMMIATRPPTTLPAIAGTFEEDDIGLDVLVEVGVVELDNGVLTLHVYK